jgi:molybdopterin-guanine dinucleotide biosynthesis protein A
MGRDKAFVPVDGEPMVTRVAGALRAAGAAEVVAIGGDADRLRDLGLATRADDHPGDGPLGGVLTALRTAGAGRGPVLDAGALVLVAACDLVAPSPEALATTVRALADRPAADVAVPEADGHLQWLHAAWRWTALAPLRDRFAAGERGVGRAAGAAALDVVVVEGLPGPALADADAPADLPPA